jgi:dUTPase
MLVPRSGLSNKCGFRIRNTVGIVDMDYRDTIKAMVTVDEPYTLAKDERFLQGILLPYGTFWGEIMPTEARNGGHGSTGRF